MEATLERGNTTVTLPLIETGGEPLVSKDYGSPNLNIQNTGSINPRFNDQWSGNLQYSILGRFHGSNAYSDATELFDLIKSNSNGEPILLNIPMDEFDNDIRVAPSAGGNEALALSYPPGNKNRVDVDLGLTRISEVVGGADQQANTPTTSGTGPIQFRLRNKSIDAVDGVTVQRTCGRPQDSIRRVPNSKYPQLTAKHKTAYEAFELSFDFNSNAVQNANSIASMFSEQLGRTPITLDFQGLFGLGEFSVVPDGSQGLRQTRQSGHEGEVVIPTVNVRRVFSVA